MTARATGLLAVILTVIGFGLAAAVAFAIPSIGRALGVDPDAVAAPLVITAIACIGAGIILADRLAEG
jgi:cation transporter-like permease